MNKFRGGERQFSDPTNFDKAQILQEAKLLFMATSPKTSKLIDVLTKSIYLILEREKLAPNEATDLFFQVTRLFQFKDKDTFLRKLIYITIKALSQQAENVYVVTSSLTTDVNSSRDDPAIRASALRALCQISDAATFASIERYVKQSIVDRHPVVASAAISSLIKITSVNSEIAKRCTNEVQEALNSDSPMVQYHALGLRYASCQGDRHSVARLIANCISQGLRSPLAICLLIKIITMYVNEGDGEGTKPYRDYIKNHINHRSDMVEYEAANALVNLKFASNSSNSRRAAVAHLRNFLTSPKAALRFAAVRSLNRLAVTAPGDVRECNLDLETLISQADCNRSIAILAITTLLKTGTENSVEKFLRQIGEFLSEIDDGFKVIVVGSVRQLCQKYPSKHPAMMDFLSNMLREEGGCAYKKAIVDTIINMIEDNEETKEKGLEQLCEFIEDCEHVSLAVDVLNVLGREGPRTKKASTYIRFIANRLLLDASPVACAAITALAKFGTIPELSETIKTALNRFSLHEDYEVMERAVFYNNILSVNDKMLHTKFITQSSPKVSYLDLEAKLMDYLEGDCIEPFDMSRVASAATQHIMKRPTSGLGRGEVLMDDPAVDEPDEVTSDKIDVPKPLVPLGVFEGIDLGELILTSSPSPITDSVSEFKVVCTKHIYNDHLVFQFDCTNTVKDMILENVILDMVAPAGFNVVASSECAKIAYNETESIFVCVEMLDDSPITTMAYFTDVCLKYRYRELDDEDSTNEDTFPLDDVVFNFRAYMHCLES